MHILTFLWFLQKVEFCFCSEAIIHIFECSLNKTRKPDNMCFSLSLNIIEALFSTVIYSIDIYVNMSKLH